MASRAGRAGCAARTTRGPTRWAEDARSRNLALVSSNHYLVKQGFMGAAPGQGWTERVRSLRQRLLLLRPSTAPPRPGFATSRGGHNTAPPSRLLVCFFLAASIATAVLCLPGAAFGARLRLASDQSVVHACVETDNGEIHYYGNSETCPAGTTPLQWDAIGSTGAPGPQGVQGLQGSQGKTGHAAPAPQSATSWWAGLGPFLSGLAALLAVIGGGIFAYYKFIMDQFIGRVSAWDSASDHSNSLASDIFGLRSSSRTSAT